MTAEAAEYAEFYDGNLVFSTPSALSAFLYFWLMNLRWMLLQADPVNVTASSRKRTRDLWNEPQVAIGKSEMASLIQ